MHLRSRRRAAGHADRDPPAARRSRDAASALYPNGERHLRARVRLAQLYPPELLAETLRIAERCDVLARRAALRISGGARAAGRDAGHATCASSTEQGSRGAFRGGVPAKVRELVEHELALIAELRYEPYFLTVHDIVRFARSQGILCQGRGSAANSAVCYCLGITEVDPARMDDAVRALHLAGSATSRPTSTSTSSTSGARK